MVIYKPQTHTSLTPGIFLGNYNSLLDQDFLAGENIKVVINCGESNSFVEFLDLQRPIISSDVIVLNLDPSLSKDLPVYHDIHQRFNKTLQNYLNFFYHHNKNAHYYINSDNQYSVLKLNSPTINGNPLKLFFTINRLLRLITGINTSAGVLCVSHKFNTWNVSNSLLIALSLSLLMDRYGLDFEASCRYLSSVLQANQEMDDASLNLFNRQYYDDVLLVDNLKKFFIENNKIKQSEDPLMTTNTKLKRSRDNVDVMPFQPALKRIA
ncbi:hypothetical protein ACI3LY_001321 [Candidozyma auris]|nr:hypothetical protein QG37_04984 [[Candida] auris]GBL52438.1 hypothetical protein CAJCM15448_47120 [[Candida] auris]